MQLRILSLLLVCGGIFSHFAQEQKPDPKWEKEIRALEESARANPSARGAVLFVGSSSIRLWKTVAADLPNVKVLNHGFGGSQIADCTAYADRLVIPFAPSKIVLYAGDNDLAAGKTPEQIAADFEAFVAKVRASLPHVLIYFISIKPSPSRWALAEKARAANKLIAASIAKARYLYFINVFDAMLGPDGKPDPNLFVQDNLHMNAKGYAIWTKIVGKELEER
jgi:lysophospholipase L1-like esterase